MNNTKQSKPKYDGIHCPKCGELIDVISERIDPVSNLTANNEVKCTGCATRFNEIYKIIGLEEVGENGEPLTNFDTEE